MDEIKHLLEELAVRLSHIESEQHRESEFITITQAAFLASVSENTIRRRLKSGSLKRYGSGRQPRISRAELRALFCCEGEAAPSRADEILGTGGK